MPRAGQNVPLGLTDALVKNALMQTGGIRQVCV